MRNITIGLLLLTIGGMLYSQQSKIEFQTYSITTDKEGESKHLEVPDSGIKIIIDTLSETRLIIMDFQLKTKDFVHRFNPAIAAPDTSDILLYDSEIGAVALYILGLEYWDRGITFYAGRTDSIQSKELIKANWFPNDSIFAFERESKDRMVFMYSKSIKDANIRMNKARENVFKSLTD